MSGVFIGKVKQLKKAIVITGNSLKTRNSLSGEFWVLGLWYFALYIFLPDTCNHAWETWWKLCVRLTKC